MLSAPAHPPTLLSPHHYTTPSTRPHLVPLTVGGRADVVSAVIARVVRALSAVRERGSAGRRVRKCAQEAIEEEHLRPTAGNAFASGPRAFAHAARFHRPVLDSHPITICASSELLRRVYTVYPLRTLLRPTGRQDKGAGGGLATPCNIDRWCWVATTRPPFSMTMQQ